jgi:thiol-disulfide isomerase/thioredoxin
MFSVT